MIETVAPQKTFSRPDKFDFTRWVEFADLAIEAQKTSVFGDRIRTYIRLGEDLGIDHGIIRRIVAARLFLLKLQAEHPDLAQALASVPYPAIDPIRRWYQYDQTKALDVARQVVEGQIPTLTLRNKEREARRTNTITRMTVWARREYAIVKVSKELPDGYKKAPLGVWAKSSIDAIFEFRDADGKADDRRKKYAILVVGPFANPAVYAHRQPDLVLQVAGAISFGFNAIVVVAHERAAESYRAALRAFRLEDAEVRIVPQPKLSSDERAVQRRKMP